MWLWVALDADSKLVISHIIGSRTPSTAYDFMLDVASKIQFDDETKPYAERRRVQLTTDGLYWYVDALGHAFGADMDYAMQQKQFGGSAVDKSAKARGITSPPCRFSTSSTISSGFTGRRRSRRLWPQA